ncbi:MAG: FAD-dependent oxidoreductase [Proteobacteria bacterium]|nr:FAD-dependent oxidoreductase [Pseudomonadota bacterium]
MDNIHDVNDANYMIFIPSLDDPSITPPGTHSMTVMGPTTADWPRPHERRYQSEEYLKMKEEETEKIIANLERRLFPNLRENIITKEMGTPATLERYLRKIHGNIGGPKLTLEQGFFKRLRARSDWKNLYCAGDSTTMGEGVISATLSAVGAANRILEDSGLPIYRPREFPKKYVNMIKGKPWTESPDPSEPITEDSAKRIGRDCQHCQEPGCRGACPAGIDGAQFARRIESGNFIGAARVLREVNPLSEICGYICPAENLCEKKCNRNDFDDKPVRIRQLHGWVCGHVSGPEGWSQHDPPPKGIQVAVVGAGPAGLSCAHYLARLGYTVDILDKTKAPGGMLAHAIPASRLPDEVIGREIEGLTMPHMNFQYGKALGHDFGVGDLLPDYGAVFLSPGLWSGRLPDIPGLDKNSATDALSFLRQYRTKKEVKVGGKVLVVGGGSVAADAALAAKDSGATAVTVVCLEKAEEMPCLRSELDEMKAKGIGIENGWGPKKVSSAGELSFVQCVSVFDESGHFHPVFQDSETMKFPFDRVILAVGQTTEPALATYLEKEFGTAELLEVDPETMQVKDRPGVYAGGDIVRGAGTVVGAVADGRRAAMAIDEKIGGRPDF